MLQLLLAAPSSGSGKTTAACALLSALKARGLEPCAFKCGPDYIDPMFHRAVLGGAQPQSGPVFLHPADRATAVHQRRGGPWQRGV